MGVLKRSFLPKHLKQAIAPSKITGTVAVQARMNLEENRMLLDMAKNNDHVLGVVGWVDLKDPNVENVLKQYAGNKHMFGFREIL